MRRTSFWTLMLLVLNHLLMAPTTHAQQGIADVDFSNIYNARHTYLGIPIGDSVYMYTPSSSEQPNEWKSFTSLVIPEGTIAMDGNIRKNAFITKQAIIFEEMGWYDTLHFQAVLPPIDPRLWIRGPQSTEVGSYFLSGEKNVSYYREYDESEGHLVWHLSDQLNPYLFKENRTQPVLTESDTFVRLYSFTPGGGGMYIAALSNDGFSFYRYPTVHDDLLGDEILKPSELKFLLPDGAITAFIYDSKHIAVVSQGQIDFYDFDTSKKTWMIAQWIPPFRFGKLPQVSNAPLEIQNEFFDSSYAIERVSGDSIRLIPDEGPVINGRIAKKADLNFDGYDDFIINFGQCGNWGDCLFGIYTQRSDGRYYCVFQTEYWYSGQWDLLENDCIQVDGIRWMKLQLYSRTDYGGGPSGIVPTSFLQFDGRNYQNMELQALSNWPKHVDQTRTFGVEKEYIHLGKTYQVGRLLLKDFKYGPLTLRVMENGRITDITAPMDEYPDLEMSRTQLIHMHERPFFFVIDRYWVYLIDLEREQISARIEPGLGVAFGEDAISGTVDAFQFFDQDQYLIGSAVNYGLFCFNISDFDHPKELLRYTSHESDRGQPYIFLDQNPDGSYNGIITQSDTLKKSSYISNFYTETEKAKYLFQNELILCVFPR